MLRSRPMFYALNALKKFNAAAYSDSATTTVDTTYMEIPTYNIDKPQTLEKRKARLLYQSRKRGMLENDLLLSTFAKKYLDGFTEEQTYMYDRLINSPTNDWDIFYWMVKKKETPKEFDNEIMDLLKKHAENNDKVLVKWIFENQHKLQTVRWCSSSLRYKELEDSAAQPEPAPTPPASKPRPHISSEISFKFDDLQVRLAAPYQLRPKPEAKELGFGKYFTDHMMKINYYKELGGWQKPEIMPFENLSLHPAAKALHYAIQLFEGLKAYRGADDKIRLFRPDLNMERMNLAAQRSGLPMFDGDELIKCIARLVQIDQEWVPHSETSTLYIRPTLIGTEATFGIMAPESALLFVILSPVSAYYKASGDGAVSIYADPAVVRAFPGGVGNRKVGSNYGPTIEATARAAKMGHHQVLWLFGPNHELTEVGAMNIFMVYINEQGDKQLSTPPLNGLILPGVTRRSIIELVSQWEDIVVKEEVITMDRVMELNKKGRLLEMFGAGTAVVISPISRVGFLDTDILIPTMKQARPVFQRIKDTLLAIQYGHIDHPYAKVIS